MGAPRDGKDTLARERTRVDRIYAGYRASRRKPRAWAADNPGNAAMRAELLDALLELAATELQGDALILDVGCGTGWWLRALAETGASPDRLTGVDLQPQRLAEAAAAVPGAELLEADARSLPLPSSRFGLVLLFTTLSSLAGAKDRVAALREARRVLRPRGLLLCYEPRLPNPLNRRTRRLRPADLDAAGLVPRSERRLTVLPPLARRLGTRTPELYPRLARFSLLTSHRLVVYREP